jgi:hypothetical protein
VPDFLKPYISRVIAAMIGGFFSWLAAKSINVDADTQQQAIAAITGIATVVFGILYAVFHKVFDKFVNPGDAAAQANIANGHEIKSGAA